MTTSHRAPRTSNTWFRGFGGTAFDPTAGRTGGPRVICFPHAGGAASSFATLAGALAPHVEVLAVQYPGRHDRRLEPPVESLTDLAETIAGELTADVAEGRPYAFFGHSMGASLAYETARRLPAYGLPRPVRLFLSGRGAPSPEPRGSDRISGDDALIAEIRRLGGTGSRVLDEPELLDLVLPTLRADYRALAGYHWAPGPPLAVPFTVLVGTDDPVVSADDAAGWLEHTSGAGELVTFEGGHFYLDAHTERVSALIRATLGAALAVA